MKLTTGLKLSLVMGIDMAWGAMLVGPGKDVFASMLALSRREADGFIGQQVEPILWWCYGFNYIGQVWWFFRTAGTHEVNAAGVNRARRQWWICAGVLLLLGLALRGWLVWFIYPDLPMSAMAILLFILLVDLVVVYWLPCALVTPRHFATAVPGWHTLQVWLKRH